MVIKISTLLELTIEGLPPTVNQMYRTARTGARYKRPEVQEWQDGVAAVMRRMWQSKPPYTGDVGVKILFTVNNKKRWDIDNRLKALLDCLQSARVIQDDSQISGIQAGKTLTADTSSTYIEVHQYEYPTKDKR